MKKIVIILSCLFSLLYSTDYDPLKGQMLSLSCVSCHGPDGKSTAITPYIAGMGKTSLYATLLDYKSGEKAGSMMPQHVKGFTDAELEQIAYYFSKVKR